MSPEDLYRSQEDSGATFAGPFDFEDAPRVEPMKAGRSSKNAWSNLRGAVQRFLGARVDRPWDEVHQELLATFGPSGISPRLLDQRLPDLVELDVIAEDDELLRRDHRTLGLTPLATLAVQRPVLYVCPATRRLRRFVPEDTRGKIRLSEWALVRQLGKRWYELTLAPIPATTPRAPTVDVVLRCIVDQPSQRLAGRLARLYGRDGVFAREKRQVGKAELALLRTSAPSASR